MEDILLPPHDLDTFEMVTRLQADIEMFQKLRHAHYFNPCTKIPKSGSFHLAWEYAKNPAHHELTSDDHEACNMLNDQMTACPGNMGVTSEMQLTIDKQPNLISTGPTCSGVLPIETHDTLGNLSLEDE